NELNYTYDTKEADGHNRIPELLHTLSTHQIGYKDLKTTQSSLEDIFVHLLQDQQPAVSADAASR
ncbi:MAG: multidrug ABC transporter ATP-binding protein, partial [Burkholderiaceae bacterium]